MAQIRKSMGDSYLELRKYEKAKIQYDKSTRINVEKNGLYNYTAIDSLKNLAFVHQEQQKHQLSKAFFKTALETFIYTF